MTPHAADPTVQPQPRRTPPAGVPLNLVDDALAAFGEHLGASQAHVYLLEADGQHLRVAHRWACPAAPADQGTAQRVPVAGDDLCAAVAAHTHTPDGGALRIPLRTGASTPIGVMSFEGLPGQVPAPQAADPPAHLRALADLCASLILAQRVGQARSEFLTRVSMEMRTPLTTMLGFAQMLHYAGLQGGDAQNLALLTQAGQHLLDMINDALDVSQIETGRMRLCLEPVDLVPAVDSGLARIRPRAATRRISVRAPMDPTPVFVRADGPRLRQVLSTLLSNAVTYNHEGGEVTVSWRVVPSTRRVRIEIADTGVGLAGTHAEEALAPLCRPGEEDITGRGLGLAVARTLIDQMGGLIGARGGPGGGATFTVDLPLAEVPEGDAAVPVAVPASPSPAGDPPPGISPSTVSALSTVSAPSTRTALYIEDNELNTSLMRQVFTRVPGTRLMTAPDGATGLSAVRRYRPDLVLVDLHLPTMDGTDVLAALRSDPDPQVRQVPVVVITADLSPGVGQRMIKSGANAFLPKPFDLNQLIAVIDAILLPTRITVPSGDLLPTSSTP